MKNNTDKNENGNGFSDYEDLLSGFSLEGGENAESGKSEDKELLSELLEGVETQDDRENSDGGNLSLAEIDDLRLDVSDDEDADESSSDDKGLKTTSGKFEIEVDDENIDYASILSEIESAVGQTEEPVSDEDSDEEAAAAIELDIVGSGVETDGEAVEFAQDSAGYDGESVEENKLEDELLREFLEEMEAKDAAEEAEEALAMKGDKTADTTSELDAITGELAAEEAEITGDLDELTEPADLDIESLQADKGNGVSGAVPTGEYEALVEEELASSAAEQDVSYTSFLSEDDRQEDDDNVIDIGLDIDETDTGTETGEYVLAVDEDATPVDGVPSYASFIGDEDASAGDGDAGFANQNTGGHEKSYLAMEKEDYSLDESDLDLALDDTGFALTGEALDEDTVTEQETAEVNVVVDGGALTDDSEEDMDFLGLEETSPPADDSFLGVSDVKEEKLPEIMLDGIEMDVSAQTAAVTRAELYLAQGRRDEASAVYAQIAEERGVSPFVAKRLKQLGLDRPETRREAEELAGQ